MGAETQSDLMVAKVPPVPWLCEAIAFLADTRPGVWDGSHAAEISKKQLLDAVIAHHPKDRGGNVRMTPSQYNAALNVMGFLRRRIAKLYPPPPPPPPPEPPKAEPTVLPFPEEAYIDVQDAAVACGVQAGVLQQAARSLAITEKIVKRRRQVRLSECKRHLEELARHKLAKKGVEPSA